MDDFTRAAVIGIGGVAALPPEDAALAPLLGGVEHARERRFLLLAGARAIYRTAGRLAAASGERASAAEREELPGCSDAAAAILGEALLAKDEALCADFMTQLAARRQRVPFASLPAVLSLRTPAARDAARPVAGNRGRWLAGYRDEWHWLLTGIETAPLPERSQWQEGTIDERKRLLAAVRSLQPPVAREWLAEVWKEESAENRAAFLELLVTNIGMDDEGFLDGALGDRSVAVRAVAATLLARILSSRFLGRCVARANEAIRFESKASSGLAWLAKTLAGKERRSLEMICEPPQADDPLAKELGVGKAGAGTGARAQLLARLVSLIDPRVWEERATATPEEIVRLAGETDWLAPLAEGFARGALLHGCTAWFLPLLRQAALSEELLRHDWVGEVARALPPRDGEQLLLDLLAARHTTLLPRTEVLLATLPAQWSRDLSAAVLSAVRRILARGGEGDEALTWTNVLPQIARGIHPATFAEALSGWTLGETYYGPSRARLFEQFEQIVRLRKRFDEDLGK